MNMEFYRPESGISFFIIGIIIYFIFKSHSSRKIFSQLLYSSKTLEINKIQKRPKNRILKEILLILGLCFISLSLMRPRWGEKQRIKKVKGSDLCIALDLSKSMLAEDMSPNRLEYAKRQLILLLENLTEARVALVGFAGGAFISAPLTYDLDAIADYLTPLNPSFVSLPSTYIQGAIITCTEALGFRNIKAKFNDEDKENTAGSILIVTDGDDKSSIESDLLKGLQKNKISVNTLLIGKNQEIFIPQKDNEGRITSFIKDPETGSPAKTRAEKQFVSKLAQKTNAKLYLTDESQDFPKVFAEDMKKFESRLREEGVDLEKEEQFQIPLLIGIILLFIEWIITETGGVFSYYKKRLGKSNLKSFLLILFLIHSQLEALEITQALRNNLGVLLFHQDRLEESKTYFEKNLESDSSEKKYLFNWLTSRLKQVEKDQSTSSLNEENEAAPFFQESFEIAKIIESMTHKEKDPETKKKWLYQLAQAYELGKKTTEAIDTYYEALKNPPSKNLDPMSRHNLARLLKENSQQNKQGKGGGGGSSGGGGQGGSGNQGNKNPENDSKPQEYKGKDHTPDQVKQIMQNIGSEERNVIKKKSKADAQKKGKEWGTQNGTSKPW